MKKEDLVGGGLNGLFIVLAFIIMYLGGSLFFIVSLSFYVIAGFFEYAVMTKFWSKPQVKISKKDKFGKKLMNGLLWVNGILVFISLYGTTIYDFKKGGYVPSVTAYLNMFIYVLAAFIFFKLTGSYFCFMFYLIPIVTNILSYFQFHYFVYRAK